MYIDKELLSREVAAYAAQRYAEGRFDHFRRNGGDTLAVKIHGVNSDEFEKTLAAELVGIHIKINEKKIYQQPNHTL